MKKSVILLFILTVTSKLCLSADLKSYDGIWQDIINKSHYYTIQIKDNQVVLIDLFSIAATGNILESTYIGNANIENTQKYIQMMHIYNAKDKEKLNLSSPNPDEIELFLICPEPAEIICDILQVTLRKIF